MGRVWVSPCHEQGLNLHCIEVESNLRVQELDAHIYIYYIRVERGHMRFKAQLMFTQRCPPPKSSLMLLEPNSSQSQREEDMPNSRNSEELSQLRPGCHNSEHIPEDFWNTFPKTLAAARRKTSHLLARSGAGDRMWCPKLLASAARGRSGWRWRMDRVDRWFFF